MSDNLTNITSKVWYKNHTTCKWQLCFIENSKVGPKGPQASLGRRHLFHNAWPVTSDPGVKMFDGNVSSICDRQPSGEKGPSMSYENIWKWNEGNWFLEAILIFSAEVDFCDDCGKLWREIAFFLQNHVSMLCYTF